MDDFIFGTLATDEKRLAYLRAAWEGVTHRQSREPRAPLPGQAFRLTLTTGPAYSGERAWVYWTTDGSDPAGEHGVATNGFAAPMTLTSAEWNVLVWDYIRHFEVTVPGQPDGTVLRYRLSAESPLAGEVFADGGSYYACYIVDALTHGHPPEWAQDAVVYHIFVDRFFPGSGREWAQPVDPTGFYGGTLRGVLEKMDYLSELGVSVLYLSPLFPSPSHHGYDSTELFEVEPRLGTKADLRALLDETHRRGMHAILDFVPNHISNQHPLFIQAASDPLSPYHDWFTFGHWPDRYETFFGVRTLPQFNLRYPPARNYMLDVARYWLEFGVDGYRVDYAIGPSPDFWADFRRVALSTNPNCWTFGEVVDPPDVQRAFEGGLDGCLDFILLEALRQSFAFGRWSPVRLAAFLNRHEAYFPSTFSRPSFLDNHDMNRFLWAANGDVRRLKLAALCQFSLVGPPIIYYGTEVGLSQERDVRQADFGRPHESRLPMLWGSQQKTMLFDYYQHLIALRRAHPALRRGAREVLFADSSALAFTRGEDSDQVATALNLSTDPVAVRLLRPFGQVLLATSPDCSSQSTTGETLITLPPLGGLMLGR